MNTSRFFVALMLVALVACGARSGIGPAPSGTGRELSLKQYEWLDRSIPIMLETFDLRGRRIAIGAVVSRCDGATIRPDLFLAGAKKALSEAGSLVEMHSGPELTLKTMVAMSEEGRMGIKEYKYSIYVSLVGKTGKVEKVESFYFINKTNDE